MSELFSSHRGRQHANEFCVSRLADWDGAGRFGDLRLKNLGGKSAGAGS